MTPSNIISINTTVASVEGFRVIVSDENYKILKARLGVLTLENLQNKRVIHISDCDSSACFSSREALHNLGKQEGGASIIIPKDIAEKLCLKPGAQVSLTNVLNWQEAKLWDAGEDKTNKFGSGWRLHTYVAKACFAGYLPIAKREEQYPGIYLNGMQQQNLNLKATLQPLCGRKKFMAVKESTPGMVGIVKVFFKNQVIEAAVYPRFHELYPGSALIMNAALYSQLPGLQIGDSLQICSRFDVEDYTTAESLQSAPEIEKEPSHQIRDWLQLFLTKPSTEDIFPEGFRNNLDDKLLLANVFEDLTKNAKTFANNPSMFVNVIKFMYSLKKDIQNTIEYTQFLQAVANEEILLHKHQDQMLVLLEKKLLDKSDDNNPHLLDVLFKLGVDLKNAAGENCLHIMYRLGKGTCSGSSSEIGYKGYPAFQRWMTQKTPEGKTPLHYLCQRGDWKELLLIGKKWQLFTSEDFISPLGTPFHDLVENLGKKTCEKYLALCQIVKHLGIECMNWFDQKDSDGSTPLTKMILGQTEPLTEFLLMLKASTKRSEDAQLHKKILDYLKTRLNIKSI
jgi:hypothetical protein